MTRPNPGQPASRIKMSPAPLSRPGLWSEPDGGPNVLHATPPDPMLTVTDDGCWLWQGTHQQKGYGMRWDPQAKRMVYLHRVNYERFVAPIPDGYQIDHLCKTPPCCNPEHLEAVTPRENTLRSDAPSAQQARQTHCKNGHPFAGDNLLLTASGRRACRTCNRDKMREYRKTHERKYPTPEPCIIEGCENMRYRGDRRCSPHIYEARASKAVGS